MTTNLSVSSRTATARTCRRLAKPIKEAMSEGQSRVKFGPPYSNHPRVAAELEGFARPLWGLAPLVAGGETFEWADAYVSGLANGTDPSHKEYWGPIGNYDQRSVEAAAIGISLVYAPETFWEPLSSSAKTGLIDWLTDINQVDLYDNNWLWFRILVNAGLRSVGAEWDPEQVREDIEYMDTCYHDDGWYTDRPDGPADYYIAWAMHTYSLLISDAMGDTDAVGDTNRFHRRAAAFAPDYAAWFAEDGGAVPYGRSLVYRFAQSAFWGALAVADVKALPWDVIRGLWARNIRWWLNQPIFRPDGTLSIGYRYETTRIQQRYTSSGSPYWAMKAFLPLLCPSDHPFWMADEAPHPGVDDQITVDPPGLVIDRDNKEGRPILHTTGRGSRVDEYGKFAYAPDFGFSVASSNRGLSGHDGTIAVSKDETQYRTRCHPDAVGIVDGILRSIWKPWSNVTITSWLFPASPWHVRVHKIKTDHNLQLVEGGFPIRQPEASVGPAKKNVDHVEMNGRAVASDDGTVSELRDATVRLKSLNPNAKLPTRKGYIETVEPNTNLCHAKAIVPVLSSSVDSGNCILASQVGARTHSSLPESPTVVTQGDSIVVSTKHRRYQCPITEI